MREGEGRKKEDSAREFDRNNLPPCANEQAKDNSCKNCVNVLQCRPDSLSPTI